MRNRPGLIAIGLYVFFLILQFSPRDPGSLLEPIRIVALLLSGVFAFVAALNGRLWWMLIPALVFMTLIFLFLHTIH